MILQLILAISQTYLIQKECFKVIYRHILKLKIKHRYKDILTSKKLEKQEEILRLAMLVMEQFKSN